MTLPTPDPAAGGPRLLVRSVANMLERVAHGAVHAREIFSTATATFESSLVAVLRNRIPAGEVNERHIHPDVEKVYYILQGEAEIECGPWQQHATAGEFIFFPAAISHRIHSLGPEDLEFIVVQSKVTGTPRGLEHE